MRNLLEIFLKKNISLVLILALVILIVPMNEAVAAGTSIVSISNETGEVNSSVTVKVNISIDQAMAGGQLDLIYNPNMVLLNNIKKGDFISELNATIGDVVPDSGKITVTWLDMTFINPIPSGEGVLFEATFDLIKKGSSSVELQNIAVGDENGNPMIVSFTNGTIVASLSAEDALILVNSTTSYGDMIARMQEYSTELGLSFDLYNGLDENAQDRIAQNIFQNKPADGYATASDLKIAFDTAVGDVVELNNAIAEVVQAIDSIPAPISYSEKDIVIIARQKVDSLLAIDGTTTDDISNYSKLTTAEDFITEAENQIASIEASIISLPDTITIGNRTEIDSISSAINMAIENYGIKTTDISNITVFNDAVDTINQLETTRDDAIAAANTAIAGLPLPITYAEKALVEDARNKVDLALSYEGVTESELINYSKLTEAEAIIDEIDAVIVTANTAISELPSTTSYEQKEQIEDVRRKVDLALAYSGVSEADFSDYVRLTEAEVFITKADEAIEAANTSIAGLSSSVTYLDKSKIEDTRYKVVLALSYDGVTETNLIDYEVLTEAEAFIADADNAIRTAQEKIANIPAIEDLNKDNEDQRAQVEDARTAVEVALKYAGVKDLDITGYQKLLDAEAVFAHGFLSATLSVPFTNYNETSTLKIEMNGSIIGTGTLIFTNGTATINQGDFIIRTIENEASPSISVIMDGFVGKLTLNETLNIQDKETLELGNIDLIPGDTNADGNIDLIDVAQIVTMFNESSTNRAYDLNGDGIVNVKDLYYIGKYFGLTISKIPVTITITDMPTGAVITEAKVQEDTSGLVTGFDTTNRTPIKVDLTKGSEDYSNVRVVVEGLDDGIQLIAQDTSGNWYNIVNAGWGKADGFALADATTDVYIVANTAGTYNATVKLINISDSNSVLTSTTTSINTVDVSE